MVSRFEINKNREQKEKRIVRGILLDCWRRQHYSAQTNPPDLGKGRITLALGEFVQRPRVLRVHEHVEVLAGQIAPALAVIGGVQSPAKLIDTQHSVAAKHHRPQVLTLVSVVRGGKTRNDGGEPILGA